MTEPYTPDPADVARYNAIYGTKPADLLGVDRPADQTYTPDPADVELVAKTFVTEAKKNPVDTSAYSWGGTSRMLVGPNEFDIARAVLAALAAAGRLLPADAEARTEWSVRVTSPDGEVTMSSPAIAALLDRDIAERSAANIRSRTNVVKAEAVSRFAATGPWLPAPTTKES